MFQSDPQHTPHLLGIGRPVLSIALLAMCLLIGLGVAAHAVFGTVGVPVFVFAVITGFAVRGLAQSYPHGAFGLCNGVTLIRAAMVALLSGAIFAPATHEWLVFAIAVVAFALDGLDGWLARRSGLTSDFGARFDMEIDALLGAVLALILLMRGTAGPEILVLGFMRYAFVFASIVLPALRNDLPESMRRKTICVVQIAALIFLLCPLAPAYLISPVAVLAAMLLTWSFAVDTRTLMRKSV